MFFVVITLELVSLFKSRIKLEYLSSDEISLYQQLASHDSDLETNTKTYTGGKMVYLSGSVETKCRFPPGRELP